MQNQDLLNKLSYRSLHRGCKETDFLLGKYGEAKISNMKAEELKLFDEFLEENDMQIYDWILEKYSPPKQYEELLQDIREFHSL